MEVKAKIMTMSQSVNLIFSHFLCSLSGDGGRWWIWDRPPGLLWGVPAGRRDHFVWHLSQSLSHGLSGPWHGESTWGQVELPTLREYHKVTSQYYAEKAIMLYIRGGWVWFSRAKIDLSVKYCWSVVLESCIEGLIVEKIDFVEGDHNKSLCSLCPPPPHPPPLPSPISSFCLSPPISSLPPPWLHTQICTCM